MSLAFNKESVLSFDSFLQDLVEAPDEHERCLLTKDLLPKLSKQEDFLERLLCFLTLCPFPETTREAREVLKRSAPRVHDALELNTVKVSSLLSAEVFIHPSFEGKPRQLLQDIFCLSGLTHLHLLLSITSLEVLEKITLARHYLMFLEGPLPPHIRAYLAILACARFECTYLIEQQRFEFLKAGGDPTWLESTKRVKDTKIQSILKLNALLAHTPWQITANDIKEIIQDAKWAISELCHAIVILCDFHSLSSVVLATGLIPERSSAAEFIEAAQKSLSPRKAALRAKGFLASTNCIIQSPTMEPPDRKLNLDKDEKLESLIHLLQTVSPSNGSATSVEQSQTAAAIAKPNLSKEDSPPAVSLNSKKPEETEDDELFKGMQTIMDEAKVSSSPVVENRSPPITMSRSSRRNSFRGENGDIASFRETNDFANRTEFPTVSSLPLKINTWKTKNKGATVEDSDDEEIPERKYHRVSDPGPLQSPESFIRAEQVEPATFMPPSPIKECKYDCYSLGVEPKRYRDFDCRSDQIFRKYSFNWQKHGVPLMNKFLSADYGRLLNDEMQVVYQVSNNSICGTQNVDTSPFRHAIWQYSHRLYGVFDDTYNYEDVNTFLCPNDDRTFKQFLKKVCVSPDDFLQSQDLTMVERFGMKFPAEEMVHITLLATTSKKEACLLHGLNALKNYTLL